MSRLSTPTDLNAELKLKGNKDYERGYAERIREGDPMTGIWPVMFGLLSGVAVVELVVLGWLGWRYVRAGRKLGQIGGGW